MFAPNQYQLLDFGRGRKLERFGRYLLDRPAPAAEGIALGNEALWPMADGRFERLDAQRGSWQGIEHAESWRLDHALFSLQLRATESGQVGVFPEQAANWDWIAQQVHTAGRTLKVLNLFAYTGGSTLAAAAAGAEVVHVDAAKNIVGWARRNAERSALADRPIRWIAEDAGKFVERERRRGNRYDAVILDPPSYGHGPKGELWKLDQHLADLLAGCSALIERNPAFLLVSCHSPGIGPAELAAHLRRAITGLPAAPVEAQELTLTTPDGRELPCGVAARWSLIAAR